MLKFFTWAAYASNGLPHAHYTLAIGYCMCSIRQQSTEYLTICYRMHSVRQEIATVCAAQACKLLQYAKHTLAICYRKPSVHQQGVTAWVAYACKEHNFTRFCYHMRSVRQQFDTVCASNLLPYAQAICYRMRSVRQQSASVCAVYANRADHILTKSSFNQWKKLKIRKSYFDTFKWIPKEYETTFFWC